MRFTRLIMVISLAVAILLPHSSYAQLDAASLARAQREQQRQGFGTDNSMGMNGLPGMGQDMMGEEGTFIITSLNVVDNKKPPT